VPVQSETFSSILHNCSESPRTACTEFDMLFLLEVLRGFGFTEQLVTHSEGSWYGPFHGTRRARTYQGRRYTAETRPCADRQPVGQRRVEGSMIAVVYFADATPAS